VRKNLPDQFYGPLAYRRTRGQTVRVMLMRKGPFGLRVLSFSSLSVPLFSLSYYPLVALRYRQVGSLLRNGFPDFFATIKRPFRSGIGVGNGQCALYIEGELELPPCRTCAYGFAFKIWRENEYVNLRISREKIHVRVHRVHVRNDREKGLSRASAERRKNSDGSRRKVRDGIATF